MPLDEFQPLGDAGAPNGWRRLDVTGAPSCVGTPGVDITVKLQAALDALQAGSAAASGGTTGANVVLHIPAGDYCLSDTVTLYRALAVSIVGDAATTTRIAWTGSMNKAMIRMIDSHGVTFGRLKLDGRVMTPPTTPGPGQGTPCNAQTLKCCTYSPQGGAQWPEWLIGVQALQTCEAPIPDGGPSDPNQCTPRAHSVNFLEFVDAIFENLPFAVLGGDAAYADAPTYPPYLPNTPPNEGCEVGLDPGPLPGLPSAGKEVHSSQSNYASFVVRRSLFRNISQQAVSASASNALAWLIEDSVFHDCHRSIQMNWLTIVAVNNLFFNDDTSAQNDTVHISAPKGGPNVIRGNVSIGANQFLALSGVPPFETEVSGNYVVVNDGTASPNPRCYALDLTGNSATLLDNYISGPDPTELCPDLLNTRYAAIRATAGQIAHGHNAYSGPLAAHASTSDPQRTSFLSQNGVHGEIPSRYRELCVGGTGCGLSNDTDVFGVPPDAGVGAPGTPGIPAAAFDAHARWGNVTVGGTPPPPSFAPLATRQITNVAATQALSTKCMALSGAGCAEAINQHLASLKQASPAGSHALYFPSGLYYVDGQIELPGDFDITVLGDGLLTSLRWRGTALDKYFFHAQAPSKAMVRDLSMQFDVPSTSRPGGILIDSKDLAGPHGLVYAERLGLGGVKNGVVLAGVDNVLVRLDQISMYGETGFVAIGRGNAGGGNSDATLGLLLYAGGNVARSNLVAVKNWGKAVLIGTDNESKSQGLDLDQPGYLTMSGGRMIPTATEGPYALQANAVIQSSFRGTATFANLDDGVGFLATSAAPCDGGLACRAEVLALGNVYSQGQIPGQAPAPPPWGPDAGPPPECAFVRLNDAGVHASAQMGLLNGGTLGRCSDRADPSSMTASAFADRLLGDLRRAPSAEPMSPTTCGETRVRIYNVSFSGEVYIPSRSASEGIRVRRVN